MSDLPQRIKVIMKEQNFPLNSKTISLIGPTELLDELVPLLTDVGTVERTERLENKLKVTYSKVTEAFLAREAFNGLQIGEIQIIAIWEAEPNKLKTNLFPPIPDVFTPLPLSSSGTDLPPSTPLKYTSFFPIQVPNDRTFNTKARVLGAKGCNFYKIVDTCAENLLFDSSRAAEIIKLRIIEEPEFGIKISSRFLDILQSACKMTTELLSALYDEYKRYCEIAELTPPDLTVMNLQKVKGRLQALKEGYGSIGNCMAKIATQC